MEKTEPKCFTKCPDCGATISVKELEDGGYKFVFIKHNKLWEGVKKKLEKTKRRKNNNG